jgi:hypothetical protein
MPNRTTSDARAASPPRAAESVAAPRQTFLVILYTATMLISAALLFAVQPMFARMVLPLLGGSPAVWNTALVFYQVVLLAGYAYAYLVTRWLGLRVQLTLHAVLLALPFLVLPIALPAGSSPPPAANPLPWLLGVLATSVGLPFLVVATSSPLLQRWFATTGHRHAGDPYFLYGASNLGSLVALIGYPLVVERWLPLADQSGWWTVGYVLLVLLFLACLGAAWGAGHAVAEDAGATPDHRRIEGAERLRWLGLAAVPVSLMLSVTTYISTDISAIPLLWVVPLALYLSTFIVTFARRPPVPHQIVARVMPFAVALLAFALAAREDITNRLLILVHLGVFLVVALACHGELARRRPATSHLTEFYFWLSLGGAVGGIFNSLVAPLVFDHVVEYPLTLMAAVLLGPAARQIIGGRRQGRPGSRSGARSRDAEERSGSARPGWAGAIRDPRLLDVVLPAAILSLTAGLVVLLQEPDRPATWPERTVMFGLPVLLSLLFLARRLRFSLALGAVILASSLYVAGKGTFILTDRTFFGVNRVMLFPSKTYHVLGHGNTMHGAQSLDPARRREPLTYFYPNGPLGQAFAAFGSAGAKRRIAVIGLGAGSIACYRQPGQQWTFYEIDPSVVRIARDPQYFTYLQECAPQAEVVLGDGRLSLAAAPAGEYDVLVMDAFTSDAVPIHLLTREALQLYLDKLAPRGVMLFNISNRHLHLQTVIGNLAVDAGLICRVQHDLQIDPRDAGRGKMASQWAIVARSIDHLGALATDARWVPPTIRPGTSVWTDDFNSLLSVFSWN